MEILVSLHSRTSHLVRAPPQLNFFFAYPSFNGCAVFEVDDFQRLIFDNSQSSNNFSGKPKTVSHPTISQESLEQKSMFTFTLRTIYKVNGTDRYLPRQRKLPSCTVIPYLLHVRLI